MSNLMILFMQISSAVIILLWLISGFAYACGSASFLYKCTRKKLNIWLMIFSVTTAIIITALVCVYFYEYAR